MKKHRRQVLFSGIITAVGQPVSFNSQLSLGFLIIPVFCILFCANSVEACTYILFFRHKFAQFSRGNGRFPWINEGCSKFFFLGGINYFVIIFCELCSYISEHQLIIH